MDLELSQEELFRRMCAWDDNNFIMCAGSGAGSDKEMTQGIVDGHAYTVIQCIDNAGGTEYDMIQMRNPWGSQEYSAGIWKDGGSGWKKYPKVYEACGKPVIADDGIFWIQREDFFKYFKSIYVCAKDMKAHLS
mmetsp:Transcript_15508/g.23674  ORF Transcript_15508/g.23674 Transcript_15508/m.23674 type:complete len:134 (+) Transcript_15508:2-403(+)